MADAVTTPRAAAAPVALGLRSILPAFVASLAALALVALVAVSLGPVDIPPATVARIIASHLPGVSVTADAPARWDAIVWDLRLPRVALAGLVGASLAYAGATYQGVFRNPLADPYLIGVAAGAGLGATVVIVSPITHTYGALSPITFAAFTGALAAVTLSYALSRLSGVNRTTALILAGVAVSSIATSITTFLMMTFPDESVLPVLSWLLGGFNVAGWDRVGVVAPYAVGCWLLILPFGRLINVLQTDEEQAAQLGVPVERVKLALLALASLAAAASVSVSGLIGFVGLIVPHAVRLVWGPDYRRLLPMSAVLGAAFLILADLLARTALDPREIPVGVITSLVGAPFFLALLRLQRGQSVA